MNNKSNPTTTAIEQATEEFQHKIMECIRPEEAFDYATPTVLTQFFQTKLEEIESNLKQSLIQEIREKLPKKREKYTEGSPEEEFSYNQALDEVIAVLGGME